MRVSVDVPEPKAAGLEAALAKQFAEIQRQLMGLVKSQQASQEGLVNALQQLVEKVGHTLRTNQPSDALAEALQGIKTVMEDLPGDLKTALDAQYQAAQSSALKTDGKPHITVKMPEGLLKRLDTLQEAVVTGLQRSRNRTFGSNY